MASWQAGKFEIIYSNSSFYLTQVQYQLHVSNYVLLLYCTVYCLPVETDMYYAAYVYHFVWVDQQAKQGFLENYAHNWWIRL